MKKVFFPHLDGLRFIAFFAVFLFHSFYTTSEQIKLDPIFEAVHYYTREGYLGVNLFFVLSGFLITYLLIEEFNLNQRIDVKAFYIRRILRIWPLYYLCVFFGFFIYPWLKAHLGDNAYQETAQLPFYLAFLANYSQIFHGVNTPTLAVLWSVCIEEQFYLVWPLLVRFTRPRHMPYLLLGIIVLSTAARFTTLLLHQELYEDTLSVISDMAIGGLAAWLCLYRPGFVRFFEALPSAAVFLGHAFILVYIFQRNHLAQLSPYWLALDRIVLALLFAFLILEQNFSRQSRFKIGRFKWLSAWGKYTYGLYCFHFLALLIAYKVSFKLGINQSVTGVIIFDNLLGLALALGMSFVSYHAFEKYFLKFKQRFSYISRD